MAGGRGAEALGGQGMAGGRRAEASAGPATPGGSCQGPSWRPWCRGGWRGGAEGGGGGRRCHQPRRGARHRWAAQGSTCGLPSPWPPGEEGWQMAVKLVLPSASFRSPLVSAPAAEDGGWVLGCRGRSLLSGWLA